MRAYLVAFLIIIADRITKWLVTQNMIPGESFPIIGEDLLRFTYVQNPGIAFGIQLIPGGYLMVFQLITSLVLIAYLYHIRRQNTSLWIPLSLILGGAVGNAIDRIFYGEVIDFIDVDFPDVIMLRWPVFNIADSAVTIGMCLLVVYIVFQPRVSASPAPPSSNP
jgi:signal peptidase II